MRCIEISILDRLVALENKINRNMRCIEIIVLYTISYYHYMINRNMRCIEIKRNGIDL